MNIQLKSKYFLFKQNGTKISALVKAQTKAELKDKLKNKKLTEKDDIMLITLKKTTWDLNTKIPINMLGGPIKVLFSFYNLTPKNNLQKKEDPRAIQFLFYTYDYYLKNKIKIEDLKRVGKKAFANSLEKRPLAPKLMN